MFWILYQYHSPTSSLHFEFNFIKIDQENKWSDIFNKILWHHWLVCLKISGIEEFYFILVPVDIVISFKYMLLLILTNAEMATNKIPFIMVFEPEYRDIFFSPFRWHLGPIVSWTISVTMFRSVHVSRLMYNPVGYMYLEPKIWDMSSLLSD